MTSRVALGDRHRLLGPRATHPPDCGRDARRRGRRTGSAVSSDERALRRLLGPGEDPVGVVEAAPGARWSAPARSGSPPPPAGRARPRARGSPAGARTSPPRPHSCRSGTGACRGATAPRPRRCPGRRSACRRRPRSSRRAGSPPTGSRRARHRPGPCRAGPPTAASSTRTLVGNASSAMPRPIDHRGGHDHRPAPSIRRALPDRGGGAVAQRGGLHGAAGAQARLVAPLEGAVGEEALRRELARHAEAEERAAGHGPAVAVEIESLGPRAASSWTSRSRHASPVPLTPTAASLPTVDRSAAAAVGAASQSSDREREQPRRPGSTTHQNFSHFTALRSRPLAISTSRTRLIVASPPAT